MHLTQYTDFALRTLMYLGSVNRSATIAEVAGRVMVSRNHLVKVVHNLGKLGFVITERGKSGGIRLACLPELINVADVVRKMEPNFYIVECLNRQKNRCPLTPACEYKRIVALAQESFLDVLGRHTVADLVRNRHEIATLLNVAT
ncbi:MAG: hypothetical protein AMXMBFR4_15850 [Candidatus Hydrogenedentota bacterium]